MDPAEEIVSLWLKQQGFFVMSEVDVGYRGKEIDFLAVDPRSGRRAHVEIHASVRPSGPLRPWGPLKYGKWPLKDRVRAYYYDKFIGAMKEGVEEPLNRCVERRASEVFGGKEYERWLILAQLHPKDDPDAIRQEFKKYKVEVFFLKDILKQMKLERMAKDSIGRLLQLLASQLTEEAKDALLGIKRERQK